MLLHHHLLLLLLFLLFFPPPSSSTNSHHLHHSSHNPCSSPSPPCPPFLSSPPFPFSFTPGCGHPSFLLRCSPSTNRSLLTISSTRFPLIRFHPHSHSLLLRPSPLPLNLSLSPFRLSCSSLPTHHPHLLCSPHLLRPLHPSSNPPHVLLSWDPHSDPYFSLCSSSCHPGSCGYDPSSPSLPFLCFPPSRKLPASLPLLLILLPSLLSLAFLSSLAALLYRRYACAPPPSTPPSPSPSPSPSYSYDHLLAATDGFSPSRKLGDGGFGSVYLADLGRGLPPAAVKRLHHGSSSSKSFRNEVLILSSLRHPNLVRLRGHCRDPRGLLLVYDYAPNGTLADHLHGKDGGDLPPLTWRARVDAALQVASALEYLHFFVSPPVVHRDITSSNIFVDGDMRVRVGDFGLSRLLPREDPAVGVEGCVRTGPQGTPGYLDPDYYLFSRLTEKSDVYSFGVVLLEMITGMKAVDAGRGTAEVGLADMVVSRIQVGELRGVVDPAVALEGEGAMGTVEAVAELAFRCLAADKDDRPDSREVVGELRRIRDKVYRLQLEPGAK